ncbi:hypothetical protein F383_16646 [Gossypium arboreum]|uniref:Uncharacterized protein n=1 Tax=Gossypium arboreum TaxID=29729 RepID=A0A0B0NGX5_GOSAR|nr:hypothetical protein F383_16646 [Gossypium arboreum]
MFRPWCSHPVHPPQKTRSPTFLVCHQ